MRSILLSGLVACLAACGKAPAGETLREADVTARPEAVRVIKVQAKGRIIDTAGVLAPADEQVLAERVGAYEAQSGKRLIVVTVSPAGGDSMEQIGWAVGGGQQQRPTLFLIDPVRRSVRLEGELTPERKAAIAGAMQSGLVAGRLPAAIVAAIAELEQQA